MAIRRAKQKEQVIEKLSQVAPPGETFVACVHVETGPSPWLNAIFDEIPGLGLIVALTRRFYFLTLTNSSVVVNTANRWTNRPGEVVAVFPRHSFPVSRVKRASIWSSMYLQLPTDDKPKRLNIHRYWRVELDQLSAAFPPGSIDPSSQPFEMAPQAQPPFPQQQPYPTPQAQPFPPQQGQPHPPQQQPYPAAQAQPPFPPQPGAPVPPPAAYPQQGAPIPPQMPYPGQPGQPGPEANPYKV
ncbi:hypothetical protein F7Q99_03330 [Streptomyces kaniharaensis]|uniref:Uncharacterized protein n=1 Tax=Streptomyces kaniharaensis TaxID=212423 RepID=A0A6N7KLW6_9ACTN|nr:hypothetical protein [Streptomyces kaniharaensis]MQS11347.1 hypothetical protein [Streptomyces kaniharaensis]